MTSVCCPECQLRFSKAATIHLTACPVCGRQPKVISSLEQVVGFQLASPAPAVPAAATVALPVPAPTGARPC